MNPEDTRFGFSVIGGVDEGLPIQLDEIKGGEKNSITCFDLIKT